MSELQEKIFFFSFENILFTSKMEQYDELILTCQRQLFNCRSQLYNCRSRIDDWNEQHSIMMTKLEEMSRNNDESDKERMKRRAFEKVQEIHGAKTEEERLKKEEEARTKQ